MFETADIVEIVIKSNQIDHKELCLKNIFDIFKSVLLKKKSLRTHST